jgi:hypothetical protein
VNEEHSQTARLKIIAPGLAWLPRFVRDKLTPALVGSAITFLFGALAYVFNSPQKDIARVQESVTEMKKTMDEVLSLSTQNHEQNAVLSNQVTELTSKVDHQQERWERIDSIAEIPPHARRPKR